MLHQGELAESKGSGGAAWSSEGMRLEVEIRFVHFLARQTLSKVICTAAGSPPRRVRIGL